MEGHLRRLVDGAASARTAGGLRFGLYCAAPGLSVLGGILPLMTKDTWTNRDLPVLRAAVDLYEKTGREPRATSVEQATGLDHDTVQRALRALYREPYFEEPTEAFGGEIIFVGAPTGAALRVAGQWPSPESQLERLIAALEAAAEDEARPDQERSRFKQAALWLGGAASQIAISALGGAGGNLMTGG